MRPWASALRGQRRHAQGACVGGRVGACVLAPEGLFEVRAKRATRVSDGLGPAYRGGGGQGLRPTLHVHLGVGHGQAGQQKIGRAATAQKMLAVPLSAGTARHCGPGPTPLQEAHGAHVAARRCTRFTWAAMGRQMQQLGTAARVKASWVIRNPGPAGPPGLLAGEVDDGGVGGFDALRDSLSFCKAAQRSLCGRDCVKRWGGRRWWRGVACEGGKGRGREGGRATGGRRRGCGWEGPQRSGSRPRGRREGGEFDDGGCGGVDTLRGSL